MTFLFHQKSAWKFAQDLVNTGIMRLEFFGAQTLRTKIQFEFHDMSEKYQTYYQNFLFQWLREIDEQTSTVIVTQVNVYFCFHLHFGHLKMKGHPLSLSVA